MKRIFWVGSSKDDVKAFPIEACRDVGFQLDKVPRGDDPDDWKPMTTVGTGVREIRIRDASGAFRVIYLVKISEAIYVLHAFQKKTRTTTQRDLSIARDRLRAATGKPR